AWPPSGPTSGAPARRRGPGDDLRQPGRSGGRRRRRQGLPRRLRRARPPVAIVIAAYNEEGAIGPVIRALPRQVCGLATEAIVVADGCADGTAAEAGEAGAMVCDVPVNRGQGAALRLGYRLAREGGAAYIV